MFEENNGNKGNGGQQNYKQADAFLNLFMVGTDGVRRKIPKGSPLYNDQRLGRSIKNAEEKYQEELAAMTQAKRDKLPPNKEFQIIGTWQSAEVNEVDIPL